MSTQLGSSPSTGEHAAERCWLLGAAVFCANLCRAPGNGQAVLGKQAAWGPTLGSDSLSQAPVYLFLALLALAGLGGALQMRVHAAVQSVFPSGPTFISFPVAPWHHPDMNGLTHTR